MTSEDVLNEFRAAGALREGHFVLSSGLHSPVFLQKALVFGEGEEVFELHFVTCRLGGSCVRSAVDLSTSDSATG